MSQPPIPPTFEDSAACLAKRFSGLRPSYLRRVKSIWSCFRATSYRSAERDAAYWALVQRFIDYARKALHTISTNLPLISGIISIGGGMLFALYFIDIHFMPNLDAASALFLFFVALSGGFIVIFLAFVAFFPGLCARAWTQGGYKPRELWLWFLFPWLTLVCSTALLYFIKASPWWMLVLFGAYCLSPIIVDRAARKDFKNVCINKSLRN